MTDPASSAADTPATRTRRLPALVASVLAPGTGHLVRGRIRRGGALLGALLVLVALVPHVPYVVFLALGLMVYIHVDVLWVRDGAQLIAYPRILTVVLPAIAIVATVLLSIRAFYVEAYKIPSAGMSPTLQIDDYLYVNKTSYWFSDPAPGDVIVFEYPCRSDTAFIKRVVARGGDTVEIRCGRTYVNGTVLPLEKSRVTCQFWDRDERRGESSHRSCAGYRERGSYSVMYTAAVGDSPRESDFPRVEPGQQSELPSCTAIGMGAGTNAAAPFGELVAVAKDHESTEPCTPRLSYRVPNNHMFVMGDNRDNSSDSRYWGSVPVDKIIGKAARRWWVGARGGTRDWGRIGRIE